MIASTNSRSREDQQDQQPTTTTITDTTNKENSPFFIDDEYKLRMTRGEEEEEDFPEMVDHVFNYARLVSDTSKMYQLKNYYAGASNGFVRVYTAEGHKYWLAQAMTTHRAPDFKVHFSVEIEDIPKAFDILAKHFFLSRCKFGMKAYMLKDWKDKHASEIAQYSETVSSVSELSVERSSVENSILLNSNVKSEDQSRVSSLSIDSGWPEHMRGREITVYIYRYYDLQKHHTIREYGEGGLFKEYPIHVKTENNPYYKSHFMEYQHMHPFEMFELEKKHEEPLIFFRKWVQVAEELLEHAGIINNGCAFGDIPLGGKYASFRNETFVPLKSREKELLENQKKEFQTVSVDDYFMYPPNDCGWNASGNDDAPLVYEALRFNEVRLYDHKKWFGIHEHEE